MISTGDRHYNANDQAVAAEIYYGLSTDEKPTSASVGNGSAFIEMDTSSLFFFDEENEEWLEWGAAPASANVASLSANPSLLGGTADLGIINPGVETNDEPEPEDVTE